MSFWSQLLAFYQSATYLELYASLVLFLQGLIGICMLFPGSQPESALQACLDFLTQFSRKPPSDLEKK